METSKTGNAEDWEPVTDGSGIPLKLVAWRQELGGKAKQEKKFRFYSLYSLVIKPETVRWAWVLVRRNNGAPGVDGWHSARSNIGRAGELLCIRVSAKGILGYKHYVRQRLTKHLERRSQRPYKLPEGQTNYQNLNKLGLITL